MSGLDETASRSRCRRIKPSIKRKQDVLFHTDPSEIYPPTKQVRQFSCHIFYRLCQTALQPRDLFLHQNCLVLHDLSKTVLYTASKILRKKASVTYIVFTKLYLAVSASDT